MLLLLVQKQLLCWQKGVTSSGGRQASHDMQGYTKNQSAILSIHADICVSSCADTP